MSDLNESMAPFENAWANFRNAVLTHLTQMVSAALNTNTGIGTLIKVASFGAIGDDEDAGSRAMTDVHERIFKEGSAYARPDRFQE